MERAHIATRPPSSWNRFAMASPMPRLAPVIMATLLMDIDGKVALITGSAKRIGRETAIELARRGAQVAVHHRDDPESAYETLRLVEQAGSSGAVFQAELTDAGAVQQLFQDLQARFGALD